MVFDLAIRLLVRSSPPRMKRACSRPPRPPLLRPARAGARQRAAGVAALFARPQFGGPAALQRGRLRRHARTLRPRAGGLHRRRRELPGRSIRAHAADGAAVAPRLARAGAGAHRPRRRRERARQVRRDGAAHRRHPQPPDHARVLLAAGADRTIENIKNETAPSGRGGTATSSSRSSSRSFWRRRRTSSSTARRRRPPRRRRTTSCRTTSPASSHDHQSDSSRSAG